jgi:hypothetical protein
VVVNLRDSACKQRVITMISLSKAANLYFMRYLFISFSITGSNNYNIIKERSGWSDTPTNQFFEKNESVRLSGARFKTHITDRALTLLAALPATPHHMNTVASVFESLLWTLHNIVSCGKLIVASLSSIIVIVIIALLSHHDWARMSAKFIRFSNWPRKSIRKNLISIWPNARYMAYAPRGSGLLNIAEKKKQY